MITEEGQKALRRYLAGEDKIIADTIVLGIGNSPGEFMQCEWMRLPVTLVGTNPDTSKLIFKATGVSSIAGSVYEIGLMQGPAGASSDITLSHFEAQEGWTGSFEDSRLDKGLILNGNTVIDTNNISLNSVKPVDQLVLATKAGGAGTVKVKLGFNTGASEYTFTVTNGYNITKLNKTQGNDLDNPSWDDLTSLEITSNVLITLDLLKIEVKTTQERLVARKTLNTPYKIEESIPLEIEYPIGVTINNA